MHAGILPSRTRQAPPGPGTPRDQAGNPPGAEHTGRYGQWAGGMHPTGMQSCFFLQMILESFLEKELNFSLFL